MKKKVPIYFLAILAAITFSFIPITGNEKLPVFCVSNMKQPIKIDGNWDKDELKNCDVLKINQYLGVEPAFHPIVEAKLGYDKSFLYVIFRVSDRFVRCVTKEINGPVWNDSCVEFFFSPDQKSPQKYFNLEVNCGGAALMHYNIVPRKEFVKIEKEEIENIQIAHSLPEIVDPERTDSVIWTVEYRIPFSLIEKYSKIRPPQKGDCWKANFYKIADKTSNQHYISWSPIQNKLVDFHQPQFFGELKFE